MAKVIYIAEYLKAKKAKDEALLLKTNAKLKGKSFADALRQTKKKKE